MQILKHYSHKRGLELLREHRPHVLAEISAAIQALDALTCLTKVSKEQSKIRRWGGLLFSPVALNNYFKEHLLEPQDWVTWDESKQKYVEPVLYFPDDTTSSGGDRFRKMDGLKEHVGLDIQLGKYAFMGYDIFSKMIIFKNNGLIDYGIEIVLVQDMVHCMSTGISAFEALMIDFEQRGEADIDIPVLVWGIGPTDEEWEQVREVQRLFRENPDKTRQLYPAIGKRDRRGVTPGPK